MSYEDGQSYTLEGRVYPSLRAMIRVNRWHEAVGMPAPYPDLASYYAPSAIVEAVEAERRAADRLRRSG